MNMHEIGLRISTLRKQRDMTQLELADKMGVSYQAVSGWERGSTMPDISRLPEISQVLGTSIDELLGNDVQAEIVKNVLTQQTDIYTNDNQPHLDDIIDVAPVLKPSQMDNLIGKVKPISLGELTGLVPFISKEVLGQLAMKAQEVGDIEGLVGIAPFLSREILDELAVKIETVSGIGKLVGLAPFISSKTLGKLAAKVTNAGNLGELQGIAPFLDRELLGELVLKATTNE